MDKFKFDTAYLQKIATVLKNTGFVDSNMFHNNDLNEIFNEPIRKRFGIYIGTKNRKPKTNEKYKYTNTFSGVTATLNTEKNEDGKQSLILNCQGQEFCYFRKKFNDVAKDEFKVNGVRTPKYANVIAVILYDILKGGEKNLIPKMGKSEITSFKDFKNCLAGTYRTQAILNNDTWEDIQKSPEKLCFYLFDIVPEDFDDIAELQKKLSEWKNVNISDSVTIKILYNKAKEIVEHFSIYPLYRYLFCNETLKHRNEIRELLKYVSAKEKPRSPIISVLEWAMEVAEEKADKSEEFTAFEFLHEVGFLAHKIKHTKKNTDINYHLTDNEITILRSEYESKYSHLYNSKVPFDSILNSFKASVLCKVSYDGNGIFFKIKPFRLVCSAIYEAHCINRLETKYAVSRVVSSLKSYFPENDDGLNDKVNLDDSFNLKLDDYCFFGLALISELDSGLQEKVLDEFCLIASDFSLANRRNQICIMFLLSTLIADDTSKKLSRSRITQILNCTYAKALYRFQFTHLKLLTKKPVLCFKQQVERAIADSCSLDANGKAKGQPLFYFSYALTNAEYDCKDVKTPEDFLKLCTKAQAVSWTEKKFSNAISCLESCVPIAYDYFFESIGKLKKTDNNVMFYTNGTQMLSYTLANILNSKYQNFCVSENLQGIYEVSLIADYQMRKRNPLYPEAIADGHLLCGSYRLNNAKNVCPKDKFRVFTFTEDSEIYKDYKNWLCYELRAKNLRYVYLMANMLRQSTNFFELEDNKKNELLEKIKKELINCESKEFLEYDNFDVSKLN